jgi:hypothetical protein
MDGLKLALSKRSIIDDTKYNLQFKFKTSGKLLIPFLRIIPKK